MHLKKTMAVATLLVVLVAACGRGDDGTASGDDGAETDSTETTTDTSGENPDSTTASSDTEGEAPSDTTGEESAAVALADGGFGDLGVVCSPGEAEATPVDAPGIDGTTINISTFADPGFQGRPGLNQEFFDTAEAVVDWCNDHGGIRGYPLEVHTRDAALVDYAPRMIEACDQDFAIVGGGVVLDDTGQADRLACGLPDFAGFVVSAAASGADLVAQPVPNPLNSLPTGDLSWLDEQFPEAKDNIGIFYGDIASVALVADRYREGVEQLGWNVVYDQSYNPGGESNWKPFAQAMRDADVKGLLWVGEPENLAALRQAMVDIDWTPQYIRTDTNHYDENLITVGGDAIGDIYIRTAYWPFERADENKATSDYFELMETYRPDGKFPAQLATQGLSAWMMFFTSAGECIDAGDLSRDCVYETARNLVDWTGGGLHAPHTPASDQASECFAVALATPEGFEFPDVSGFGETSLDDFYSCGAGNVVALTGDYGEGAKCPSGKENPLPSECNA